MLTLVRNLFKIPVKHLGFIFRRLFTHALEEIKEGYEFSHQFRLLPAAVETHLASSFDVMLWKLLKKAASNLHTTLGTIFSVIDPNQGMICDKDWDRRKALLSASGADAKQLLKSENKYRYESKRAFLQDERSPMVTDDEAQMILDHSTRHLIIELDKILGRVPNHANHFLLDEFKIQMKKSFLHEAMDTNWEHLAEPAGGT